MGRGGVLLRRAEEHLPVLVHEIQERGVGAEVKPTVAARIRALQDMTVPELRERYREVFGEETRSRKVAFFP